MIFFVVLYPMTGLPMRTLPLVFLFTSLNIQLCSAMSMLISAVCMDQDAAITVAICFMVLMMCAGGYFADMLALPWWVGWVRYTSNYYYGFAAVLRAISEPYDLTVYQEAVQDYHFSQMGYWGEAAVMMLMIFV